MAMGATLGGDYYQRERAAGKTYQEAMRCLRMGRPACRYEATAEFGMTRPTIYRHLASLPADTPPTGDGYHRVLRSDGFASHRAARRKA